MHRYFVLIKSFSLSVGYSLKGKERINPRGLVEKAVKESRFHFSMIFYVQKIKTFRISNFRMLFFPKLTVFLTGLGGRAVKFDMFQNQIQVEKDG